MKRPGFRTRFRLLLALQVLALFATLAALAWVLVARTWLAAPIVLGLLSLLQLYVLHRFLAASVAALQDFLDAVLFQDLSGRFSADDVDEELTRAFNTVLERFRSARADRETQALYLDLVVGHVPVPLLAVGEDDSIRLQNHPMRRLANCAGARSLSDLSSREPGLAAALKDTPAGQRRLVQTQVQGRPVELRVTAASLRHSGGVETLYAVENLAGELDAREDSAWRNLIRVLTHEIMNTVTPLSSLARTAEGLAGPEADPDLQEALATIARRSETLLAFMARYRELLALPTPEPAPVAVAGLFADNLALMAADLDAAGVAVTCKVEPSGLLVPLDRLLLDQVLVNLLRNALAALEGVAGPRISLQASLERDTVVLEVADNGRGMDEATRSQAFVPFFTTRRDGSGIGLPLARQVITAHGGRVLLLSTPGTGTRVRLLLPP